MTAELGRSVIGVYRGRKVENTKQDKQENQRQDSAQEYWQEAQLALADWPGWEN
jgi:hypothetical protein